MMVDGIDYAENPEKTDYGIFIVSVQNTPEQRN